MKIDWSRENLFRLKFRIQFSSYSDGVQFMTLLCNLVYLCQRYSETSPPRRLLLRRSIRFDSGNRREQRAKDENSLVPLDIIERRAFGWLNPPRVRRAALREERNHYERKRIRCRASFPRGGTNRTRKTKKKKKKRKMAIQGKRITRISRRLQLRGLLGNESDWSRE